MDLLYLSHCVPNPPDKGEKIRAHHILHALAAAGHRVHLAAFARRPSDLAAARELAPACASVHVEPLSRGALPRAAWKFLTGGCLTTAYFDSRTLRAYIDGLARTVPLAASLVYTAAMAQYAPPDLPLLLDMTDVDSEKWLQYSRMRPGGPLYALEGRRLRRFEIAAARRARCTFLATEAERALLDAIAPGAVTATLENGVDFDFFDPARVEPLPELQGRRYLVFIGVMDYYPNIDAVRWFASEVLPQLRRRDPGLEFLIVGRSPARAVRRLHGTGGVTVTGGVPDVRPYLAAARAVVAPLRLARGIQNKVLEALAMDKPVLASPEICRTFGPRLPNGVIECRSPEDYWFSGPSSHIRQSALRHFSWDLTPLLEAVGPGVPA
jgi:sugar transferase (PEP-CTERM/EpsH1 system associated)